MDSLEEMVGMGVLGIAMGYLGYLGYWGYWGDWDAYGLAEQQTRPFLF